MTLYILLPIPLFDIVGITSSLFLAFPCLHSSPLHPLSFIFHSKMAHRNNRRRARRSRSRASPAQEGQCDPRLPNQFTVSQPSNVSSSYPWDPRHTGYTISSTPFAQDATFFHRPHNNPARLWQSRYAAWQDKQREHAAKLEAQQIQLFGGEPGDDVGLCYKMLEYFGRLDYIS